MDWVQFLADYNIHYVTSGPNTKKNEISIRCPMCGSDDPSQHMGLRLDGTAWGCHRNAEHRGKSPVRLIVALLGCSYNQAKLTLEQYDAPDPDSLPDILSGLLGTLSDTAGSNSQKTAPNLIFPSEFQAISASGRFYDYLYNRGLDNPIEVATTYNLQCCNVGKWKDRIIIPVYKNRKLIAWTGRAITDPINAPRYLSTSNAIKTTVLNDDVSPGKLLFITEGPFDAIKLDFFGYRLGASAVAVFGTSITIEQILLLSEISKRFQETVILLDSDAVEPAFNLLDWLPRASMGGLPDGIKDPGMLSRDQVETLIKERYCV
ncbi:MAG TPA: hypothetical protein VFR24_27785 [Candidatus Angelobacter sp.]|nr:hypothetical protein [Candidatus Angelobacter sp.]